MSAQYDAIVIGAGHNGLLLGAYLAKSGMSVGVFEKQHEIGGGLCTQEIARTGFLHNLHSNFHAYTQWAPAFRDLDLKEYGIKYYYPEVQHAMPLSNGKCPLIHMDPKGTYKNFSRFSKKDAETYIKMKEDILKISEELVWLRLWTPPHELEEGPGVAYTKLMNEKLNWYNPEWADMTPSEVIDEVFEDESIKTLYNYISSIIACDNDIKGLGNALFGIMIAIERYGFARGGSHQLAHATSAALHANGGIVFEGLEVKKILIKDGVAVGVKLADGTEVYAKKIVASNLSPQLTFLDLVGEEYLDSDLTKKVANFQYRPNALLGVHVASKEPPKYTAAEWDPDMNRAYDINIGYEETEDIFNQLRDIRAGRLSKVGYNAWCNTLFDETQAPPNKHSMSIWQYIPNTLLMKPEKFDEVKEEYSLKCVELWRNYAPNLTKDNILGVGIFTPGDIVRRNPSMVSGEWSVGDNIPEQMGWNRPVPELGRYKTPIKNLYLSAPSCHTHSITYSAGYNAFRVIAEDLGIKRWWCSRTDN